MPLIQWNGESLIREQYRALNLYLSSDQYLISPKSLREKLVTAKVVVAQIRY